MSEKNITDLSEIENINISEEDLPDVISEQFEAIVDIDKRIVEAENRCATAKETADKMILAKALNQKDAINATQDAVRSLAEAQTALSDAQRMLFENQQKMADGMRYLLVLGASSIAMNRVVIAELEAKLKQATKEQLSDKAREELIGVIKLLREQESAFSKQDRMSDQIKTHGREIETIHRVDALQDETDKKHDSLIAENASKNVEQDKQIAAGVKKDVEQDSEIQRQQNVDKQHDEQLKKIKTLAWAGLGIAVCALVIAIVGLFLKNGCPADEDLMVWFGKLVAAEILEDALGNGKHDENN